MIKERILLMLLTTIVMFGLTSGMYMGTVDGWVVYMNGTPASNVNVTAHVIGCSVSCNGSVLSDDNGYYLIDNLNMNPGDTVDVVGVIGSYSGSGSGTADAGSVAHVNITLCAPPSPPTLTHQPDISHDYVDLTWVSGTDPDGYLTYDVYQFNSHPEVDPATPPQHETGLTLGTYTWRVKTCNNLCCSPWSTDTFQVIPPTQPTLTHQPDTHNDTVNLTWVSGTDPEGQPTYDEFFIDSTTISPATPPQTITNLSFGSHTWGARTCNSYFCSPWSTDTFTRYNDPPSSPVLTPVPDGNYSCVNLTWVSGTDPDGDSTCDQIAYGPYYPSRSPIIRTPPRLTRSVMFQEHTSGRYVPVTSSVHAHRGTYPISHHQTVRPVSVLLVVEGLCTRITVYSYRLTYRR